MLVIQVWLERGAVLFFFNEAVLGTVPIVLFHHNVYF